MLVFAGGSVDRLRMSTTLLFEIYLSITPLSATTLLLVKDADSLLCNGGCTGRDGWQRFNWVPPLAVAGKGTFIGRDGWRRFNWVPPLAIAGNGTFMGRCCYAYYQPSPSRVDSVLLFGAISNWNLANARSENDLTTPRAWYGTSYGERWCYDVNMGGGLLCNLESLAAFLKI